MDRALAKPDRLGGFRNSQSPRTVQRWRLVPPRRSTVQDILDLLSGYDCGPVGSSKTQVKPGLLEDFVGACRYDRPPSLRHFAQCGRGNLATTQGVTCAHFDERKHLDRQSVTADTSRRRAR